MMEAGTGSGSGGGGGGGPAPFLLKTYEMVDDASTDAIVSWSASKSSFVVWNPQEFARVLLPSFFKHNNFSSFIRQLNTYGFRKIDPERWEFSNEDFVKDRKHLLKNIHRRKPIHSHSNPQNSFIDPERAAFEEEIEKLTCEKKSLEESILGYEEQRSTAKNQLEDLTQRVEGLEQRQESVLSFLEKAVHNPTFVDRLARKVESMDFSAYSKKRRLPEADHTNSIAENSFIENHSSSKAPECGSVMNQDFSRKLRLELSPSVSDINLVSHSAHSSNEDWASPQRNISSGEPKDAPRTSSLLFPADTLELSDTGTSYAFKQNPIFSRRVPSNESPGIHAVRQDMYSNEEVDGHISCQLNLTLASSPLQINKSSSTSRNLHSGQEVRKSPDPRFNNIIEESDVKDSNVKNKNAGGDKATLCLSKDASNNEGTVAAQVRVNDIFWEQFLTERPGSTENEEASSNYRANAYEEQEDKRPNHGISRNGRSLNQLSL